MSFFDKLEDFLGSEEATKEYKAKKDPREHGDQIQILFESQIIQDLFNREQFTKIKSQSDSKRFRDLGNEAYKNSQDIKALELYSRSCQASTNDNELVLALANRSAAALRLNKLDTALKNVDWAIQIGTYPKESIFKLHERKAKIYTQMGRCKEASLEYLEASKRVEDANKASEMTKLSEKCLETYEKEIIKPEKQENMENEDGIEYTPNTNFPGLSDFVEIKYEDGRGRFGVAKRDIQVGEVIGVEEPVVSRLKKSYELNHCNCCMKFLEESNFLPCLFCEDVKYCSLECRRTGYESYHKYECGLSTFLEDTLIKMKSKTSEVQDYYRLGYRAISQKPMEFFRESYKDLIHSTSNLSLNTVFHSKSYNSLSSLVENYKDDAKKNLWAQISACFVIRSLREKGYFGELNSKKLKSKTLTSDERIIANLARWFIEIMKFNTHGILESFSYKDMRSRVFGNAVYTNLALLNHSCAPNITKYFRRDKVYILASATISKGSEISENYFPYYLFMDKESRVSWLKEHYTFDCNCKACNQNYPLLSQMQSSNHRNYLCSKCQLTLVNDKDSKEYLLCSKCSGKFMSENLKNDIIGLLDELQHRYDNKQCPEALLEIAKSLTTKIAEPDPHFYKFQKIYSYSLQYMKGNKSNSFLGQ